MSEKKLNVGGGGEGRRMITRSMTNEGKEHPLMNDLVLEAVFQYCSVNDLQLVRQVCPQWRDCAQKMWNKSVKLSICEHDESSTDERAKEVYERFLQMVKSDIPVETGSQGNWTKFCSQVKTLELSLITFPNIQCLRNALFRYFPKLKNLILRPGNRLQDGQVSSEPAEPLTEDQLQRNLKHLDILIGDAEFPLSWIELLSRFPSLEKIDVKVTTGRERTEGIFQAINQIREKNSFQLNLKHISTGQITPSTIATLMDRRLSLESLEFLSLHDTHALRDVLQVHVGTLKTLVLTRDAPFPQGFEFPQLTKLIELRMTLSFSPESIEFLKFTPNLQKLKITSYGLPRDRQAFESNFQRFPITLNACKSLEIWDSGKSFSLENWKSLMQWTPSLESLKVFDVDNAKFSMICAGWTNLVELQVLGMSKVDGSGITGWDEQDVQQFDSMALPKRSAARRSRKVGWQPMTVPRANITGLKNLQIFKMITTSPIKLSRAAGFHGIEMLPDLRRLCIQNYEIIPRNRDYWNNLHEMYPYSD